MIRKIAWVFALVFLLVGALGFVPGVTEDGMLLGIFEVDMVHNLVHLATGLVAALVALASDKYSRLFFQVFGVVYAAVAVIGFVQGDTVLGLIHANMADHILHVAIAAVSLYVGFLWNEKTMAAPAPQPMNMGGGMGA